MQFLIKDKQKLIVVEASRNVLAGMTIVFQIYVNLAEDMTFAALI